MSHPSLGLPPRDLRAGHPDDAASLIAARATVAARTLAAAVAADPTIRGRYSDLALRELLADIEAMVERLAVSIASDDPDVLRAWADGVSPRYRKRSVPLDDLVALSMALRSTAAIAVSPAALASVDAALDAAIAVFRWHRRLGGDARKRNAVIAFIYKGA